MKHALKPKETPEKPDLPIKALKKANDSKPQKAKRPFLNDKERYCCNCATD